MQSRLPGGVLTGGAALVYDSYCHPLRAVAAVERLRHYEFIARRHASGPAFVASLHSRCDEMAYRGVRRRKRFDPLRPTVVQRRGAEGAVDPAGAADEGCKTATSNVNELKTAHDKGC